MDLISREAIKGKLEENRNLFVTAWEGHIMSNYDKSRMDEISACIGEVQNCPSAFEGMTNRDVLNALFPIDENKGERLIKVYLDHEPIESFALTTTQKWLDSPYKGVSE